MKEILIVEDDAQTRAALIRLFRRYANITTAESAEEALEILNGGLKPAVIFSDYSLPKINGIDFFKLVKQLTPTSIRFILTGHIDLHNLELEIQSEVIHRVLLKPWENDILILQLTEAFKQNELLIQVSELEKISSHDPVSGLYNYRFFQTTLQNEIERSLRHELPLSVISIDIDHFKQFNDQKGHPEGNNLLKSLADIFTDCVRSVDFVCRVGGDEFTIILPNTDKKSGFEIAERIRKRFEDFYLEKKLRQTISLGLASIPEDAHDYEELLRIVDQALYQAKNLGKNKTVVAGQL